MLICSDDTALQRVNLTNCFETKEELVQFVKELLDKSQDSPTWIIITRPVKSEEFYVGTVITASLEDIPTGVSSDEQQTT